MLVTPSRSPAVVKALSDSQTQAAVCGALSCRDSPEFVIRHPDYGRRTLCLEHARDLVHKPVNQPPAKARQSGTAAERPEAAETAAARPTGGNVEVGGEMEVYWPARPDGTGRTRDCGEPQRRLSDSTARNTGKPGDTR